PDLLNQAASLPGLGDVAVEAIPEQYRESTAGRLFSPVAKLAGNIIGDPLTYVGGIGAAGRATRAAEILDEGAKAARIAEAGGDVALAASLAERARASAKAVAETLTPAEHWVNRAWTAEGVAYAPEIVQSFGSQAGQSIEDIKAGRYADAAVS